jgi:hypothetical protein
MSMFSRSQVTTLALILVCAIGPTPPIRAQGILGAATMGAALSLASNKAGDLIRQARSAGNDLLLSTGVEIQNAVASAQIAYEASLNKTMAELEDYERKVVTDINTILITATDRGAQEARDLLRRTQLIANTLPLASKIPQFANFSPIFLMPGGESFRLEITGNFPFGFDQANAPRIEVNGTTLQPVTYTTTFMVFAVPKHICGATPTNAVGSCAMKLVVPWDASRWYHIFRTVVAHATFNIDVGVLPATPGRLSLSHRISQSQREEETRYSEVFHFDSHADDIEENRALRLTSTELAQGWRVVSGSASFELVQHIEGAKDHDWYDKGFQNGNDQQVIWRVRTEHKSFGSSGKIKWRIKCRITRNVTTSPTVAEEIPMSWAMSRLFEYPAGQWRLVWTRFDGTTREFNQTDVQSSFLKVHATGSSVQILTFGI